MNKRYTTTYTRRGRQKQARGRVYTKSPETSLQRFRNDSVAPLIAPPLPHSSSSSSRKKTHRGRAINYNPSSPRRASTQRHITQRANRCAPGFQAHGSASGYILPHARGECSSSNGGVYWATYLPTPRSGACKSERREGTA